MNKFCVYFQEVTLHYKNEYAVLECCDRAPMSESEYEEDSDNSSGEPTYVPDSSDSDSD